MNKEQLAELLGNVAIKRTREEKRLYLPHSERTREPVTVHFTIKFDSGVISVRKRCNLPYSCDGCPFRGLCESIEERIRA